MVQNRFCPFCHFTASAFDLLHTGSVHTLAQPGPIVCVPGSLTINFLNEPWHRALSHANYTTQFNSLKEVEKATTLIHGGFVGGFVL